MVLVGELGTAIRINRYIVGCKLIGDNRHQGEVVGINRYIVGCKFYYLLV